MPGFGRRVQRHVLVAVCDQKAEILQVGHRLARARNTHDNTCTPVYQHSAFPPAASTKGPKGLEMSATISLHRLKSFKEKKLSLLQIPYTVGALKGSLDMNSVLTVKAPLLQNILHQGTEQIPKSSDIEASGKCVLGLYVRLWGSGSLAFLGWVCRVVF